MKKVYVVENRDQDLGDWNRQNGAHRHKDMQRPEAEWFWLYGEHLLNFIFFWGVPDFAEKTAEGMENLYILYINPNDKK